MHHTALRETGIAWHCTEGEFETKLCTCIKFGIVQFDLQCLHTVTILIQKYSVTNIFFVININVCLVMIIYTCCVFVVGQ